MRTLVRRSRSAARRVTRLWGVLDEYVCRRREGDGSRDEEVSERDEPFFR